ncbi:MAG: 50S ribosomal protein L10 [Atopobiaceae bacterium]|nr:50S ribosomal protein L10 [Atopobiaceae bacterium]
MPSKANVEMLEKISESIKNSEGFYLVDYNGLSVKEAQHLRKQLREADAEMKVYKNNLVRLALANAEMPAIDEMLKGTCACVFYNGDPSEAAKAIKNVSKELKKLEFVGGIGENNTVLSADDVKAIADLPSREEIVAKLLGTMNNPMVGIARVCNGVQQGLVTALSAIVDQKNAA